MLTWLPAYVIDSLVVEIGVAILRPITSEGNAGFLLIAFNAAVTFVAAIVGIPSIVLGAILYRGLRPVDFVAK
jgi:cytochrome c biogenesis protein CcdA